MTIKYYGNIVDIKYDVNDISGKAITLIDGKDYKVIPSDQFK